MLVHKAFETRFRWSSSSMQTKQLCTCTFREQTGFDNPCHSLAEKAHVLAPSGNNRQGTKRQTGFDKCWNSSWVSALGEQSGFDNPCHSLAETAHVSVPSGNKQVLTSAETARISAFREQTGFDNPCHSLRRLALSAGVRVGCGLSGHAGFEGHILLKGHRRLNEALHLLQVFPLLLIG